ncbi:MAG: hypothetical protein U9N60_08575 [Thermodesulfobacteriota bacterium]|nr:hypothetical protein [Thermodesulfobacteriota bacterium]
MKKVSVLAAAATLFFGIGFTACSSDGDIKQEKEKGTIDKITDKAAQKAVKEIRTPIDKARATRGLGEQRTEAIDHATKP